MFASGSSLQRKVERDFEWLEKVHEKQSKYIRSSQCAAVSSKRLMPYALEDADEQQDLNEQEDLANGPVNDRSNQQLDARSMALGTIMNNSNASRGSLLNHGSKSSLAIKQDVNQIKCASQQSLSQFSEQSRSELDHLSDWEEDDGVSKKGKGNAIANSADCFFES